MAFPSPFLRLVLSGRLYNVEGWSMGFALIPNFDNTPGAPSQVPAGVISAASALMTSGNTSSACTLNTIKLNLIGTDGRYVSKTDTVLHEYATPVAGNNTGRPPAQAALAVTLRTGARRGLASTGRVYLPAFSVMNGNDGRLPITDATNAANAVATFINGVNAALPDWRVAVVSDVREGAMRAVTAVEAGRVIDTIRSRRTSMDEAHVPATVTLTP